MREDLKQKLLPLAGAPQCTAGTMDLINLAAKTPSFLPTRRIRDLEHNKISKKVVKIVKFYSK
ncbi:hypothetical protein TSAR_004758 [Trichomalopsis sarcophagae]|uniref:Uncharacterized protein n=1 Tax=Trichomalopsis sarcophagae TaxID=543379 RepID=A0A232FL35_9HYME|nr:hypothetical protein TSAR_004758 [Trichomalopsis sarcophagae]